MKLFFNKEKDFINMLIRQTEKTVEGIKSLVEFVNTSSEEKKQEVLKAEEESDELRRILVDEINHSFITPFDREDIFALSRAIDDVIDYAKSTVEEMSLLKIEPDEYIKQIVEIIYEGSKEILFALRCIKSHPNVCLEHVVRAKKTENLVERKYREGIAKLFESDDIKKILKTREIYRHLSNAADKVDEAANVVGDIIVKMT